ncbi:hypothetical protein [Methylobacter sp.]|nr:hypothetical protein [Methylobacter sp.]
MAAVTDAIWAIMHEVARVQKELQGAQKETEREIKAASASIE